ncbi:hypothetical protein DL771_000756 [Monosporascus sp. 5C6A]|nr:hypothetical protein DL771_000756 [Monosporascus sp. 5C6A]
MLSASQKLWNSAYDSLKIDNAEYVMSYVEILEKVFGSETSGVGEVADFILSAKEMVDLVFRNVPQAAPAALPWAGVCLKL